MNRAPGWARERVLEHLRAVVAAGTPPLPAMQMAEQLGLEPFQLLNAISSLQRAAIITVERTTKERRFTVDGLIGAWGPLRPASKRPDHTRVRRTTNRAHERHYVASAASERIDESALVYINRDPCFYCGTRADITADYGCRRCKGEPA